MDIIARCCLQAQESIRSPLLIDMASWCIGTLPVGERRNRVAVLGAIYDWICGVWGGSAGAANVVIPTETLLNHTLTGIAADSVRLARGEDVPSYAKPLPIRGSEFTLAVMCATMAAAVGIKTRYRVGGDSSGWARVWAEADPEGKLARKTDANGAEVTNPDGTPQFEYKNVWGYHMLPQLGTALKEQPVYTRYGVVDIWDAYLAALRSGQSAERYMPPPDMGAQFVTLLPDSWEGIKGELARMADTAVVQVSDPLVVAMAEAIVANMPEADRADPHARLAAAYAWVRRVVQYRDDPWGREVIQTPARMIRMAQIHPMIMGAAMLPVFARRKGQTLAQADITPVQAYAYGDCDEQSLLTVTVVKAKPISRGEIDTRLALGGTLGIPGHHHVWSDAAIAGRWGYCMDSTEQQYDEVGKCPITMQKLGHVEIPWPVGA